MIEIQKEKLVDIVDEIQNLLKDHYEELTLNKERVVLKPVWKRYFDMENNGIFHAITMREQKVIIGYSGWIVQPHLHYEDIIVAQNDVLFLHKNYRQGTTGIRLLKFSENEMKKLGAHKITWHIKDSNDFSPILSRMGYSKEDTILGKFYD